MTALTEEYLEILRQELSRHYVPHLPSLLPNKNNPEQQTAKQLSRALSAFLLSSVCDLDSESAARAVVDDFADNGIDAIYYDARKEILHIVQGKLKPGEQVKQAEAQAFTAGTRRLFQQDFDSFNEHVRRRQAELEQALASASSIRLWLIFVGDGVTGVAEKHLTDFLNDDSHGEVERLDKALGYFSAAEIEKELRERHSYKPVNAEIHLLHAFKVAEPRETWYGIARMSDLVALHTANPKALYERNIRYYLGSGRSDINKQIQETLTTDPEAFLYLNNGVTALCTDVKPKDEKKKRRRLKVLGLSIVNGAQTVAAAADVMNVASPPDISNAKVMVTLIVANAHGTFGPRVTRARNSQNLVTIANFASQDPVQERLRQELSALGIQYFYRPEAMAMPSTTSILLDEALRALSWLEPDPRYPVWLKSGRGDVNNPDSPAYKKLFDDGLSGACLANAVLFSRHVLHLLRQADAGSSGTERLVYRHGAQALGWSFLKQFRDRVRSAKIMDVGEIPTLLSRGFDEHRQRAADEFLNNPICKGPLAFFKNQTDTTPYLAQVMLKSYKLESHAAIPALNTPLARETFPRERLFNFLTKQAPQI
jgi:AIPR protein